jgi:para-nitrobenzyl esterase
MSTAHTTLGSVEGTQDGPVLRFAGIPFAAPPVGDLRWRPPQPAEPWDGVRDGSAFAPTAPQNVDMLNLFLGVEPEPQDEDCLYLNVWTPGLDDARRPVLVWIHGGAFMIGSGSNLMYDGRPLAERGDVVVVTLNYRLGELGFLELGWLDEAYAGSGNLGLLDQVAALEWVRDNIAGFGGDPGNVTIFGESAGGMSVTAQLAIEGSRGLFHKAIAQSGAAQAAATPAQAEAVARDYVGRAGVDSIEGLEALTTAQLLEIQSQIVVAAMTDVGKLLGEGAMSGMPFRPVEDGRALPSSLLAAVRGGSAAGIPLITGTTADEWKLFTMMDFEPIDDAVLAKRLEALAGDADKALAIYTEAYPEHAPKDLFSAAITDYAFRVPAVALGEAQLATTDEVWEYVFSWASPAMGGALGACHAIELPFLFGMAADPRLVGFVGDAPPQALAEAMQDAWLSFARTGEPAAPGLPEWPRYDTDRRAVMELDETPQVLEDPGAAEREFWEAVG